MKIGISVMILKYISFVTILKYTVTRNEKIKVSLHIYSTYSMIMPTMPLNSNKKIPSNAKVLKTRVTS